ncbi:hypothetical protein MYU51_013483 [Penicillium brevicompactum]|uniref:uncharacterized protein n=1 Tax=Penicillium brevicompactum TaxID=5074 RepID=UPI002540ADD8|nr:uncharacterized protein N7506_012000 [Penicillium brevicompactum]KAJ5319296.1 hypothetical protein N7506_012000 [Penicillium brevicompactum]
MSAQSPVILILGAGPNIGINVARVFAAKGYKVALASRSLKDQESTVDQLNIHSDLSNPDSVVDAFSKVKTALGTPSVVVYNAAALTRADGENPLSLPLSDFTRDLNVNTTSAFVAAQQAVLAFQELPPSASKTFIYTGNMLNTTVIPPLLDLGVGKSATAHVIQTAATSYSDRGFKFYYADERKADGSITPQIDGEAHAELYAQLAEGKSQGPWQQTFVKGSGYKKFAPAN